MIKNYATVAKALRSGPFEYMLEKPKGNHSVEEMLRISDKFEAKKPHSFSAKVNKSEVNESNIATQEVNSSDTTPNPKTRKLKVVHQRTVPQHSGDDDLGPKSGKPFEDHQIRVSHVSTGRSATRAKDRHRLRGRRHSGMEDPEEAELEDFENDFVYDTLQENYPESTEDELQRLADSVRGQATDD